MVLGTNEMCKCQNTNKLHTVVAQIRCANIKYKLHQTGLGQKLNMQIQNTQHTIGAQIKCTNTRYKLHMIEAQMYKHKNTKNQNTTQGWGTNTVCKYKNTKYTRHSWEYANTKYTIGAKIKCLNTKIRIKTTRLGHERPKR